MQINPEISQLTDKSLEISSDFQSPIIRRRTATTTVTVRDGETVVIGGLIHNFYERQDQKIPLLGDLPLIGSLFRAEDMQARRTELLIVLTPHVISNPSAARWKEMTEESIRQIPIGDELKDQLRKGHLDGSTGVFNPDFESPDGSRE